MRGDVHSIPRPRNTVGHEQSGPRFAVVVQSDDLPLSTVVVAPTSTRAQDSLTRPVVMVQGVATRVLLEQVTAVDRERLGPRVGALAPDEVRDVNQALRRVLALDLPW